MHEVVTAIRRVNDIIGEISAASSDQSSGVRQVSEAVNNMDRTTQQNAALVEEMAAAAASLKNEAEELVESVAVFKMGTSEASNRTPQQAPRELQASQRKQLGYTQATTSS
jgi:SAM-dependent MidA family methyltransferase